MTSQNRPPPKLRGRTFNLQLCNTQPRRFKEGTRREFSIIIWFWVGDGRGEGLLITDMVSTFKPSWRDKRVEWRCPWRAKQALDCVCLAVTRATRAYQRYQCRALLPYQTLYLTFRPPPAPSTITPPAVWERYHCCLHSLNSLLAFPALLAF